MSVARSIVSLINGLFGITPASDTSSGTPGVPSALDAAQIPLLDSGGGVDPGYLYAASATANGIVTTGAQTFAGSKTFRGATFTIADAFGNVGLSITYSNGGNLLSLTAGSGGGADTALSAASVSLKNGSTPFLFASLSALQAASDSLVLNSDAAESGADWQFTIERPATGMTHDLTLTLPSADPTVGEYLKVASFAGNVIGLDYGTPSGGTVDDAQVALISQVFGS